MGKNLEGGVSICTTDFIGGDVTGASTSGCHTTDFLTSLDVKELFTSDLTWYQAFGPTEQNEHSVSTSNVLMSPPVT